MCRTAITNNDDIEKLMKAFAGFHDSCIVSVNYNSGAYVDERGCMGCGDNDEYTLGMILHSQWSKPLELYFSGVRKCGLTGFRDNYFCDIYGATLKFRTGLLGKTRDDNLIIWADRENFDPFTYTEHYPLNNGHEVSYVIADKLEYRFLL